MFPAAVVIAILLRKNGDARAALEAIMTILKCIFPGFVIGPILASFIYNAAQANPFQHENQLEAGALLAAGLLTTLLIFSADRLTKH